MSRNSARGFKTTANALIRFKGSPLADVVTRNGADGSQWRASTEAVCSAIEQADPRITSADIQGAVAHLSSKDKDDPKAVITVGLQNEAGARVGSVHVHMDGTWKFFASRAGRDGGYDTNIQNANLPGYMPA